jgi:hypothetical protein
MNHLWMFNVTMRMLMISILAMMIFSLPVRMFDINLQRVQLLCILLIRGIIMMNLQLNFLAAWKILSNKISILLVALLIIREVVICTIFSCFIFILIFFFATYLIKLVALIILVWGIICIKFQVLLIVIFIRVVLLVIRDLTT